MTVVCIAGMHRSGTSMVARLLNLSGVYLGEEKDLMSPQSDNVEGYWEHCQAMQINDDVLTLLGGGWDYPPKTGVAWEKSKELLTLKPKAQEFIKQLSNHTHWGWKDPRNSLTLPFWDDVISPLHIVICIRNPLEVINSLIKRNYFSPAMAFNLWFEYNQRILSFTENKNRMITHYDSYFYDPYSELKRILNFLEIDISEKQFIKLMNTISLSLNHNKSNFSDLLDVAPSHVVDLYEKMCSQSGEVFQLKSQNQAGLKDFVSKNLEHSETEIVRKLTLDILKKKEDATAKEKRIQELSLQLAEKEHFIQELSFQVTEKEDSIKTISSQINEKEKVLHEMSSQVKEKDKIIELLRFELNQIKESKSWRLVKWLQKIRAALKIKV